MECPVSSEISTEKIGNVFDTTISANLLPQIDSCFHHLLRHVFVYVAQIFVLNPRQRISPDGAGWIQQSTGCCRGEDLSNISNEYRYVMDLKTSTV